MRDITAYLALKALLKEPDVSTVLDVGSGAGNHAKIMRDNGKKVVTNSLIPPADIIGDFLEIPEDETFSAIWAAHVLEHQPNVNLFLKKCFRLLPEGGLLAVTVPPLKERIVGGHLTLWNAGLLLYNVIMAGFDCSEAKVKTYDYNISILVRKKSFEMPALEMDIGDIEKLQRYFPFKAKQGFDGGIDAINWR